MLPWIFTQGQQFNLWEDRTAWQVSLISAPANERTRSDPIIMYGANLAPVDGPWCLPRRRDQSNRYQ